MTRGAFSLQMACAIALEQTKGGAWRLGSVHEITVGVATRGRQPMVITLSPRITRRRDLRGPC